MKQATTNDTYFSFSLNVNFIQSFSTCRLRLCTVYSQLVGRSVEPKFKVGIMLWITVCDATLIRFHIHIYNIYISSIWTITHCSEYNVDKLNSEIFPFIKFQLFLLVFIYTKIITFLLWSSLLTILLCKSVLFYSIPSRFSSPKLIINIYKIIDISQ